MIMYSEHLRRALREVRERIGRACARAGRSDAEQITLVAVTKGHPLEALHAAREAGLRIIGENRVGEAKEKREAAGDLGLSWHMVGHLQRNKVRDALTLFDMIQSVDSLRLARKIQSEAERADGVVDLLVQVNASREERKYGFSVEAAPEAVGEIVQLDCVSVVGIMTMAALTDDEDELRRTFRGARHVFERCREEVGKFEPRYLSMGMTNDFEIAIEEGSNMIRLGTALLGEREE